MIERRGNWNYSSPIQSMQLRLWPVRGVVLWAAVAVGPERSLERKNTMAIPKGKTEY
jgi:hypothetical protein